MTDQNSPQPGWYPDPAGSGRTRWWDGSAWTDQFADQQAPGPGSAATSSEQSQDKSRKKAFLIAGGALVGLLVIAGVAAAFLLVKEVSDEPDYRVVRGTDSAGSLTSSKIDGSDQQEISYGNGSSPWQIETTDDGQYFVFATGGEAEPSKVHVVPTDGSGETRTVNGGPVLLAAKSNQVFFGRVNEGTSETDTFMMDAAGGDPTKLASGYPDHVSDDGSRVLISEYDDDLEETVYSKVEVASGQVEELDLGYDEVIYDMSPDGSKLFTYMDIGSDDYYEPEGYIHDLDTGETRTLGTVGIGKFSEDGKKFLGGDDSLDSTVWSVFDLEAEDSVTIGDGNDAFFVPGSDEVVLNRDLGGEYYTDYRQFLVDPDTGEETQIARGDSLVVSPDGKSIVFVKDEGAQDDYEPVIYSANLDGSGEMNLGEGFNPAFYETP